MRYWIKQARVGYGTWPFAVPLCCLLISVGCDNTSQSNTNHNASANINARATPSPPVANANSSRAPTRAEYERNSERYAREARESGRSIGTGTNDGWLWVKTRFELAGAEDLRDSTINVDVENGVVTLSGTVGSETDRIRAVQIVRNIEGVKEVKDYLKFFAGGPNVSPTPTATVFDIDREVQRLKNGAAITEVPTSMELGETRIVILTLSPSTAEGATSEAEEEMHANLNARSAQAPARSLESKTKIEAEKAKYSSYMEATLSGQGFEINSISPVRQPVTSDQPTKWTWEITAKASGNQYLYLAMNAIFESEGAEKTTKTRSINTFSKTVTVKVSLRSQIVSFLSKYWQWLMTAVLIPLVVWGVPKLWKSKKKKPKKTK